MLSIKYFSSHYSPLQVLHLADVLHNQKEKLLKVLAFRRFLGNQLLVLAKPLNTYLYTYMHKIILFGHVAVLQKI